MAKAEENPFVNSPMNFNRAAPTGVNAPSFTLPQNHTLATDPFNQQAQMLSLGMPVAAFDASGGNNGYFSQAMMQQSPLMRNYSGNGLYSSNFLANGLGMGMPGWQSNGDNSFTATQANPFAAINYNVGRTVNPNLNQGTGAPSFTQGQNAQQGSFTPEYIANAQSVGLSPESAYAYQTDPQVKAYFDALNAQKASGAQNPAQAPQLAPTNQRGTWGGANARHSAPGQGQSAYQPRQQFYNSVNQVLGNRAQAQAGDYAGGWNTESSPNSRAAARADAQQMSQALGRPLTSAEMRQLQQRQLGWGFNPYTA